MDVEHAGNRFLAKRFVGIALRGDHLAGNSIDAEFVAHAFERRIVLPRPNAYHCARAGRQRQQGSREMAALLVKEG